MSPIERTSGKLENNIPAPYNFKISSVLEEAWLRVHGSKTTYWGAILIYVGICVLFIPITGLMIFIQEGSLHASEQVIQLYSSISQLILGFILIPLGYGLCYIGTLRASDQPIQAKMIFAPFKKLLRVWGASLLFYLSIIALAIIGFGGAGLLFIFGEKQGFLWMLILGFGIQAITYFVLLYLVFGFLFAPLLVFEKNMGIFQAIKASFSGFSQHWFKILVAQIAMGILTTISALPLFIGLIWVMPMSINLFGILYRTIFGVEQRSLNKDVL
jgi:hypothetical protein